VSQSKRFLPLKGVFGRTVFVRIGKGYWVAVLMIVMGYAVLHPSYAFTVGWVSEA
jgi:hypothetical protein